MTINENTRIASILKAEPAALEAIIRLSPRFEKLRNPVLRKLMAGRTSIAMASKMGGCAIDDFFHSLAPLGFVAEKTVRPMGTIQLHELPPFLLQLDASQLVKLDVRSAIDGGNDPLKMILAAVGRLAKGQVLQIINSFEPAPLMRLLAGRGYESYAEHVHSQLVNTYFFKKEDATVVQEAAPSAEGWENIQGRYGGRLQFVDVRDLPMPLPMTTILDQLESLQPGKALFVYHKRIPVFLLPELASRGFEYRVKEISEAEVHLLIFKS